MLATPHHLVDGVLGQVGEFAVVDGNVGFAARRIGGPACAGHLALDLGQHLLHARKVVRPGGGVLLVYF
jgi:hypothetical protein